MAHEEGHQQHPLTIYFWVWGLLFVLSGFSYAVDYYELQGFLRWSLILLFMFLKAGFIVAVFMHMAWERLALIYAILVLLDVKRSLELAEMGAMSASDVRMSVMPLVYAVGAISLVLATLSTICAFLRSRTATLSEIQLRLAGLEPILRAQADSVATRSDGDSRGSKSA